MSKRGVDSIVALDPAPVEQVKHPVACRMPMNLIEIGHHESGHGVGRRGQ